MKLALLGWVKIHTALMFCVQKSLNITRAKYAPGFPSPEKIFDAHVWQCMLLDELDEL